MGTGLGLVIQIVGKRHVRRWLSIVVLVDRLLAVTVRTERLEVRLLKRVTAVRDLFDVINLHHPVIEIAVLLPETGSVIPIAVPFMNYSCKRRPFATIPVLTTRKRGVWNEPFHL